MRGYKGGQRKALREIARLLREQSDGVEQVRGDFEVTTKERG